MRAVVGVMRCTMPESASDHGYAWDRSWLLVGDRSSDRTPWIDTAKVTLNTRSVPGDHAPLWCKSNFSFLEGASHAEELVEEAHRLGLSSIALTDRDGVYGMVRAHTEARKHGLQLICGA